MGAPLSLIGILSLVILLASAATGRASGTEAEALHSSRWWDGYNVSSINHCEWPGITCDYSTGVVREIRLSRFNIGGDKFQNFSFHSFPHLQTIVLSGCGLNGKIPPQIAAPSKLRYLDLSMNGLSGELPLSLSNLTSIYHIDLSENLLHGPIPWSLGNLENLQILSLHHNRITGVIPSNLFTSTLQYLSLQDNQLSGELFSYPPNHSALSPTWYLNLSNNNIRGQIPDDISHKLYGLYYLDLSYNILNGIIPSSLGSMINLLFLGLGNNHITGVIPSTLSNLSSLQYLYLQSNQLTGAIPETLLLSRPYFTVVDLSDNKLTGSIPYYHFMKYLNVSHNNLSGKITDHPLLIFDIDISYNSLEGTLSDAFIANFHPSRYVGNPKLCGNAPSLPHCFVAKPNGHYETASYNKPKFRTLPLIIGAIIFSICGFGWLIIYIFRELKIANKKVDVETVDLAHGDIFKIWNYDGNVAYNDIIGATEDFNIKYCIGAGGYGSVYRARLPCGKVVALKKLHRLEGENPLYNESFRNEAQMLGGSLNRQILLQYAKNIYTSTVVSRVDPTENGVIKFKFLRSNLV